MSVKSEPVDFTSTSSSSSNGGYSNGAPVSPSRAALAMPPLEPPVGQRRSTPSPAMSPPVRTHSNSSASTGVTSVASNMQHQHSSNGAMPMPPPVSNSFLTPEGDRFFVTLLQMEERGAWVPITQIAIMDPGFEIPHESRLQFKHFSSDMGASVTLSQNIVQRYYTVDAFLYDDHSLPQEKQAKYAREYRKFFQFLSSYGGRERYASVNMPDGNKFWLKGPDIQRARQFNENEPIQCFFMAPECAPVWTPTLSVNPPLDPAWAVKTQARERGNASPQYRPAPPPPTPPPMPSYQSAYAAHNQPPAHYLGAAQPNVPAYMPVAPSVAYPGDFHHQNGTAAHASIYPPAAAASVPSSAASVASAAAPAASSAASAASTVASTASTAVVPAASSTAAATVTPAAPPDDSSIVLMSQDFLGDLTHHHDWAFGALAELVHNSRDAGAKSCKIAVRRIGEAKEPHLIIDDDGSGMTHKDLRNALTFGRVAGRERGAKTIGKFGFGLKHGALRLGDDALILTKSAKTFSVGLLSITYNKTQKNVKAPIITRLKEGNKVDLSVHSQQVADEAEQVISQFSAFDHFTIGQQLAVMAPHGTRIIIWRLRKPEEDAKEKKDAAKRKKQANGHHDDLSSSDSSSSDDDDEATPEQKQRLEAHKRRLLQLAETKRQTTAANGGPKLTGDEAYELKFASEPHDIRIVIDSTSNMQERSNQMSVDVPLDYSLRAYLAVMFLENTMAMWVQGKKVEPIVWEKELTDTRTYACDVKHFEKCKLLLGFSETERQRGNAGLMLYWHKTLIETYRRVGIQTSNSDAGLGVIGVIDLGEKVEPKNNKQSFPQSNKHFKRILKWFATTLDGYWHDVLKKDIIQTQAARVQALMTEGRISEFGQAVQCDRCKKWRRVTQHEVDIIDGKINEDGTPGDGKERRWFCYMNRDKLFQSCAIPQDPSMEDADELVISTTRGGVVDTRPAPDSPVAGKKTSAGKNVVRVSNPAAAAARSAQEVKMAKAAAARKVLETSLGDASDEDDDEAEMDTTVPAAAAAAAVPSSKPTSASSRAMIPPRSSAPTLSPASIASFGVNKRKHADSNAASMPVSSAAASAKPPAAKKAKTEGDSSPSFSASSAATDSDAGDSDHGTSSDDDDEPLLSHHQPTRPPNARK